MLIGRRKNISQIEEAYEPDAELQWWYFDAVLDSGHRFITFFLPKTLGAMEGNDPDQPMLDIVLRKPDGETVSERRYFQPSEMKPVPGTFGADFGDECSARFEEGGLGRYILKAQAGRLAYELEFSPDLPPWPPVDPESGLHRLFMMLARRSIFTKDYFHYIPFAPRGRLVGRISLDGESLDARGTAYHEQGKTNLPLSELMPAWYWLHIEHHPWTILSATADAPKHLPISLKEPLGGMGFVQKGDQRLMATMDFMGLMVNWKGIQKRSARGPGSPEMAWKTNVRLMRPGLLVRAEITSKDVLELLPFELKVQTPLKPFWGQTVADARVEVIHGFKREKFEAECSLETMMTGAKA